MISSISKAETLCNILQGKKCHLSEFNSSQEQIFEHPGPYWFGGQAGWLHWDPNHPFLQKQRPLMCEQVASFSHWHDSEQLTPYFPRGHSSWHWMEREEENKMIKNSTNIMKVLNGKKYCNKNLFIKSMNKKSKYKKYTSIKNLEG